MRFIGSEFTINGIELSLIHNIPLEGKNNIEDALLVWYGKTTVFSAESFCSFITTKREQALCNYYAFPSLESFGEWAETTEEEIEFGDPDYGSDADIEGFNIDR